MPIQVQWLPQQDIWLAVTSLSRVFLYDLARAAHMPLLTLATPDAAALAGCTFATSLAPCAVEVGGRIEVDPTGHVIEQS